MKKKGERKGEYINVNNVRVMSISICHDYELEEVSTLTTMLFINRFLVVF